uniref:Stigma-specific STIG1-like protein 1 n=1 Tax=Aegilops tauschii TaxID=37682 RepID=M8C9R1_AEGTA
MASAALPLLIMVLWPWGRRVCVGKLQTKTKMTLCGCSKKSAEACLVTGTACCSGQCVDTVAGVQHCGGCNKACEHGRTCCGGRCVDLLFDKKNCGTCSNKCNKKCSYGFCDYAQ